MMMKTMLQGKKIAKCGGGSFAHWKWLRVVIPGCVPLQFPALVSRAISYRAYRRRIHKNRHGK